MKAQIKKIKSNPDFFRVYYEFDEEGESSVPFNTIEEAQAFCKGVKRCFEDYRDYLSGLELKKNLRRNK